ncbi:MAG: glycoside hydrolase family 2 TIM barrel-domain containing protein [Candidatus Caccosoma sp.]|nr:glycoside hydrolase family 2 TIM barrel-domain containing protein [Candidatus Caccosoma sp.]
MEHIFHKDIKYISVNKCAERNFYIPKSFNDRRSVYKNGSRFINLNGKWEFKYYLKNEKYNEKDSFKIVDVPKNYQYYNDGQVVYVNDYYLIDVKPPFVDDSNYGVYRKNININIDNNSSYYINFEGKDSCLYLYINKQFVGFDSVSHATSEFDITKFLKNGDNEVLVFVYEVCVGTYFECQDKIRLSGLFRDIYILKREKKHIESYKITYLKNKDDVNVTIAFKDDYNLYKEIIVLDKSKKIVNIKTNENAIRFTIKNPKMWCNEYPFLYFLKFIINNEVIYDYLGIRFVNLKNNILNLNNTKIKLLGVNHHDSNYKTGYYLSLSDYKKDLKIMKEHNINAIRTSHYPPSAELLYLCDEQGFYVMDEADIECHGIVRISGTYNANDFDTITDNIIFKDIIEDRINRMMTRDFNRCSVISFSGGNEAGFGSVMINALKKMKKLDPSRLIHYESTYTKDPIKNNYKLDFISKMYYSFEKMDELLKNNKEAILLCEFSHAMGNSCGDIYDYSEYFYKHNRVMGGFVWEFNDHLFPINLNYKKPGYGGDFNEKVHSGNFCVDGLVGYKRNIKTNIKEVKQAFAKVIVKKERNKFYLYNRFDFKDINKDFKVLLQITNFKDINEEYSFDNISLKAKEKMLLCKTSKTNCVYNFKVYNNNKLYSYNSFITKDFNYKKINKNALNGTIIKEYNKHILLKNKQALISINKETGLINYYKENNITLLSNCFLNIKRAPIDNDQYELDKWKNYGFFNYHVKLNNYEIINNKLIANIEIENILKGSITYYFNKEGKLIIDSTFDVDEKIDYLPRFGYLFNVNKKYKDFTYIGYGKDESYVDKHHLDMFNIYNDKISKNIEYIKPQETKSHLATYLIIKGKENKLTFNGMNSFSYLPYTIEELINKKHNYKLKQNNKNILCLDYKMSGIGSYSCGPELNNIYKLTDKNIKFTLEIKGEAYANS